MWGIYVRHISEAYMWGIYVRHICKAYMWGIYLRHICEAYMWGIYLRHIYAFKNFPLPNFLKIRHFFATEPQGETPEHKWTTHVPYVRKLASGLQATATYLRNQISGSPFVNQQLCTTICALNHTLVTDVSRIGVYWYHFQEPPSKRKFFAPWRLWQ